MSGGPVVSVVTSVHNGAAYLRDSLHSVLDQEGVAFEVIALDDGSTDGTPDILRQLAAGGRLRVISQENQGLTRALHTGCLAARGEFIARHDADDRSLPGRLAKQAALLRADPSLSMASC